MDESNQQLATQETQKLAVERRERVASAGGELLGAAFKFLGELVASQSESAPQPKVASELRSRLNECVEEDSAGRQRLIVTLPDKAALNHLADALAQLLAIGK
jgi:hypothetical protein